MRWAASHLGALLCGGRPDLAAAAHAIDEELRRCRDTFAIDVVSGVTGIGILAAEDARSPAMRPLMAGVLETWRPGRNAGQRAQHGSRRRG